MHILANPILGKNFRQSSLVLNDKGLWRLIRVGELTEFLFLTNDVRKIVELLDLKFEDVNNRFAEEVYVHLITSPYFNTHYFINSKEEKSPQMEHFRQFLLQNEEIWTHVGNEFFVVRTERIEQILGIEIRDKIDNIKRVLEKVPKLYKSNFNQMKKLLLEGGYKPQNFSKDLAKLNRQFNTKIAYWQFFVDQTPEQIVDNYKRITA